MVLERSQSPDRWLGLAGLTGSGIFVIAMLVMHLLQPDLSPRDEAMSYYVHGAAGWLASLGLVALGLGSISLSALLTRHIPATRAGIGLLALWGFSATLGGIFAADPPGNWDAPPSLSGSIHGIAALIALVALPIAAILISRAAGHHSAWRPRASALRILSFAILLSLIAFSASLVPVMISPGPPVLFGLVERVYFVFAATWLIVLSSGPLLRPD
jgi:hypothetical protein